MLKGIVGNKTIFVICLVAINLVFSIDALVDWGIFSGMLYIPVVLLALFSVRKKEYLFFAWLASVYIFFEIAVLWPKHTFQTNLTNHGLSFMLIWLLVFLINHGSQKGKKKEAN